jgi:ribonucleoside-diphosphate reductase alpha chain
MDIFSQVTGTISQSGRRGALMVSLDVNHPDIEEFIDCKTDLNRVTYANISVRVNDAFMKAVELDSDYLLTWPCENYNPARYTTEWWPKEYNVLTQVGDHYVKKVKAKQLFQKLAENNWNYAEPGILYWDTMEQHNMLNTNKEFKYSGINPCGELPMNAGSSCLLGSINLSEFVVNPFTKDAYFDTDALDDVVSLCVKALNEVLEEGKSLHPLQYQQTAVDDWKFIGLGTFGLADALIKLGIKYGHDAKDIITEIYSCIAASAILESVDLAKEFGYSKYYFSNLFNSKIKSSLPKFLNSVRINKSLELLRSNKITDVAYMVGFNSPQQFYLNFKKVLNVTPKQYLKNN